MSTVACHPSRWCFLAIGLTLLLTLGCDSTAERRSPSTESETQGEMSPVPADGAQDVGSEESSASSSPTSADRDRSAGHGTEESQITVATISVDDLTDTIARHAGNLVLIDYWATWCGPCLQQFPHTIELSHKYKEAGLQVLSVSCDDPAEGDKVLSTLKKLNATTENYHTSTDMNQTFEGFDIRGGIPFYQLYDRAGNLRYRFNGAPAPGDEAESTDLLEMRIRELLEEPERAE